MAQTMLISLLLGRGVASTWAAESRMKRCISREPSRVACGNAFTFILTTGDMKASTKRDVNQSSMIERAPKSEMMCDLASGSWPPRLGRGVLGSGDARIGGGGPGCWERSGLVLPPIIVGRRCAACDVAPEADWGRGCWGGRPLFFPRLQFVYSSGSSYARPRLIKVRVDGQIDRVSKFPLPPPHIIGSQGTFEICGLVTDLGSSSRIIEFVVEDGTGAIKCYRWLSTRTPASSTDHHPASLEMTPQVGQCVVVRGSVATLRDSVALQMQSLCSDPFNLAQAVV